MYVLEWFEFSFIFIWRSGLVLFTMGISDEILMDMFA